MHTMASYTVRNGQQPGRAKNSFIDQGELVAMKTLSDRKAPRYGKGQFCDKMTANTWTDIIVEVCGFNKKTKNGSFANAHFCI